MTTKGDVQRRLSAEAGGRGGEGMGVVGSDRTVRHLDATAERLLGEDLRVGDALPGLLLDRGTIEVAGEDGEPRLQVRSRRAPVDGRVGWVLVVADVTSRRSPEQRAIDLLGLAGHELRTPIAAIAGYAGTIRVHGKQLGEIKMLEMLEVIERQAGRLGRMATTLLSLSKSSGSGAEPLTEQLVAGEVVAEVLELLGELATDVEVSGDAHAELLADPAHLQEILTNLVSNAFKYGQPPVLVRVQELRDQVRITVVDHGDGVPAAFRSRMWEPFARARAEERPRNVDGAGLGLSLVQTLATLNDAEVTYEDNVPHGSAFTLTLPRASVALP